MIAKAAHSPGRLIRKVGVRRIRLASGLILFTYLLTHYTNHALGNVSLSAMSAGLQYHVWLWHSWIGTLLLYSALAVHASLGLWALYERRHFRFKVSEAIQLIFGQLVVLIGNPIEAYEQRDRRAQLGQQLADLIQQKRAVARNRRRPPLRERRRQRPGRAPLWSRVRPRRAAAP